MHMKRAAETTVTRARRLGRRPHVLAKTVRRKNLRLDQRKLDLLRDSLGLDTDQAVVERVIDDAVIDRELVDATLALGGSLPRIVDVGKRR
jgi:hypothetical protein